MLSLKKLLPFLFEKIRCHITFGVLRKAVADVFY
jgi:hypothetical protein